MTDEKGPSGLTPDECREHATEVVEIMEKALEAALRASSRPGWALAALIVSAHSLRVALEKDGRITSEETADLTVWATDLIAAEPDVGVSMAQREISRRQRVAAADEDDLRNVVAGASACLQASREYSESVTGSLVLLHVARHMALAVLKHQNPDPDVYEDAYSVLRAMENAIQPEKIQVVDVSKGTQMSKGGDA